MNLVNRSATAEFPSWKIPTVSPLPSNSYTAGSSNLLFRTMLRKSGTSLPDSMAIRAASHRISTVSRPRKSNLIIPIFSQAPYSKPATFVPSLAVSTAMWFCSGSEEMRRPQAWTPRPRALPSSALAQPSARLHVRLFTASLKRAEPAYSSLFGSKTLLNVRLRLSGRRLVT